VCKTRPVLIKRHGVCYKHSTSRTSEKKHRGTLSIYVTVAERRGQAANSAASLAPGASKGEDALLLVRQPHIRLGEPPMTRGQSRGLDVLPVPHT